MKFVAEGRTLLFVSHNLSVVEAVCSRGLLLLDGKVEELGDIRTVLSRYISIVDEGFLARRRTVETVAGAGLDLVSVTLHDSNGVECYAYPFGSSLDVRIRLKAHRDMPTCFVAVGISDGRLGPLATCSMRGQGGQGVDLRAGEQTITCRLKNLPFAPRNYEVWMGARDASGTVDVLAWSQVAASGSESSSKATVRGSTRRWHGSAPCADRARVAAGGLTWMDSGSL